MRASLPCLAFVALFTSAAAAEIDPAAPARAETASVSEGECVSMTVTASAPPELRLEGKQLFRITFHNRCAAQRVLYWCAEHPSRPLSALSVCAHEPQQAGIAAPLYALVRKREFQWTFPPGTRIHFVDCERSSLPTRDLRCSQAPPKP